MSGKGAALAEPTGAYAGFIAGVVALTVLQARDYAHASRGEERAASDTER